MILKTSEESTETFEIFAMIFLKSMIVCVSARAHSRCDIKMDVASPAVLLKLETRQSLETVRCVSESV